MAKIIPGILTADELEYEKRLRLAEHTADLIQIDIIDGKFAPNTTIDSETVIKFPTSSQLEMQLMVIRPQKYIAQLAPIEYVSRIIFPYEIETDPESAIYQIRKLNKSAGLSLNPATDVKVAIGLFDDIDVLLLLTAEPGFSGKKLGEGVYERIHQVKTIAPALPVEIDIGVNFENAQKLAQAGADFLVSSSALYNSENFAQAFQKLARLATGT